MTQVTGGAVGLDAPRLQLSKLSGAALVLGHCVGMVDLVGLPVWVSVLIEHYKFQPQIAGLLVTIFLLGAVAASITVSRLFNRINRKTVVSACFAVGTLCFFLISQQTALALLVPLHIIGGLAVGGALSIVHGTMGRTGNPHRLYAIASAALGLFGIVFMIVVPNLILAKGGWVFFVCLGVILAATSIMMLTAYPNAETAAKSDARQEPVFHGAILAIVFGVILMTFNQTMVFSFVDVIGKARGFPAEVLVGVLIAQGFVNFLVPAPLAGFLQNRVAAWKVVLIGPVVQLALAILISNVTNMTVWVPVTCVYIAVQIFTHTFAFGLLARMDRSGRAVSATPAMLMTGSAFGPIVGGLLMQHWRIEGFAVVALVVASLSVFFFFKGTKGERV